MTNDRLAQIAADGMGGKIELLHIPEPIPYEVGACALAECPEGTAPLATEAKMSTTEALYKKLSRLMNSLNK